MSSQTVLILDVVPQTLAVVRSLSRAGFHVVLGRCRGQRKTEVEWSRHCHEVWLHPPFGELAAFEHALAGILDERPDIRTIFPVAEPGAQTLFSISCLNDRSIDVISVPERLFFACRDKQRASELAAQAGLLIPESHVVKDIDSLHKAANSLEFPLIMKSLRSEALVHGRKAYIVPTLSAFHSVFSVWPAGHRDLLVQRYIEGRLESCQFVASRGRLVGYCEVDVVRSNMPDGTGLGIEFLSVPPTPDVLEALRNFVGIHDYSGPGLMQFVRDEQSHRLYFIENNPRLGAGIAHAIDSGMDCPLIALQAGRNSAASLPEFDPSQRPYRNQYRAHWLTRDIRAWASLRSEFDRKQQIEWLQQLVRSFLRADGHFIWQWADPLPALWTYGRFLKQIAARPFQSRSHHG